MNVQREPERIEAWSEVGARCRNANRAKCFIHSCGAGCQACWVESHLDASEANVRNISDMRNLSARRLTDLPVDPVTSRPFGRKSRHDSRLCRPRKPAPRELEVRELFSHA